MAENGLALRSAYESICAALDDGQAITPAAEWLIDSYHLVDKQFREVRSDLPTGYYKELPKLSVGPFAGYPRIFEIAWAFVAHNDSRFDANVLRRFVVAFQEAQPLLIGELWALPITLRIVLVENLRRVADLIVQSRIDRAAANDLANRLLGAAGRDVEPADAVLFGREDQEVSDAFAVQLLQRLRDQDQRGVAAMAWLERRLAATRRTADQVVSDEHMRQGAATVSISNIINSLRLIGSIDWTEAFESVSLVDEALRADPVFGAMDFASRTLYRDAVEKLGRGSKLSEIEIARRAVLPFNAEGSAGQGEISGYRLVGAGRNGFEREIAFRPGGAEALSRTIQRMGAGFYVGAIGLFTAVLLWGAAAQLIREGVALDCVALLALAFAIPLSDASIALVNCCVAHVIKPTRLPALELKLGVPEEYRTLVVVPVLLTSLDDVAAHLETLEVHHLASPEGEVYFALLSDWVDAPSPSLPGDKALLDAAAAGVARLNKAYPPGPAGPRFALLHRPRVWSASENRWMGWERKRGKLQQLNELLRGKRDSGFIDAVAPAAVRYVITLDADTRLPLETVRILIGKMAHPLNRAIYDPLVGRVVSGYGVMQPRVTPTFPVGGSGSFYQHVFSTQNGIDPYAAAVSDVYQDLFQEGSFAGKGIYDVDAFTRALEGRIPESTLLSHDLFEGIFARAGFASDVEVMEEFPPRYDVSAMRHHRWARGDWQLTPWILGLSRPRSPRGRIPAIGRWKMFDNLRRSLSAPSTVAALFIIWLLPLSLAAAWTLALLGVSAAPMLIPVACAAPNRGAGVSLWAHLRSVGTDLRLAVTQFAFTLTVLADQATLMTDAVARTLHRLVISRANLLEWVSHAQASAGRELSVRKFAVRMAGSMLLGVLALALGLARGTGFSLLILPFAALWLCAPAAAMWASLPSAAAWGPVARLCRGIPGFAHWGDYSPVASSDLPLSEGDASALRLAARSTWRFFETFVTPQDNMLPPDNFQEDPAPSVAHRTSPTNIGLYLLSTASARDFGWIGMAEAVERFEATMATMSHMERLKGHFLNWYDTRTLAPLEPKYISSVDSGNLAGHLIALARACVEWRTRPDDFETGVRGAVDALEIAQAQARLGRAAASRGAFDAVEGALADAIRALEGTAAKPDALTACLSRLEAPREAADRIDASGSGAISEIVEDLIYWIEAAKRTLQSRMRDLGAAVGLAARLEAVERQARAFAMEMQFGFLVDDARKLLSIGYLVHEDRLDRSCYDLLASEARLASFFAIAKGDLPASHWFRLGRSLVLIAKRGALVSWSGSMFEYLMPELVMQAPTGSLIELTNRLIVTRQIEYGAQRRTPWGISESAYNVRDLDLVYQYSNFGVPGLGLKRGLEANIVVAPYATALAAMIDPHAATRNLARLSGVGALGRYGYYESLDYTPARLPAGESVAIVRAYMAHHQGMSIVAFANVLLGAVMRSRFHSEPIIQASELLLQERPPRDSSAVAQSSPNNSTAKVQDFSMPDGRRVANVHDPRPATHILSNGRYCVMLSAAGSGYSRWGDIAIGRWREDSTRDNWGSYVYLRDVAAGVTWSATYQPCAVEPDEFEAVFNEDRVSYVRRDGTISTALEVVVSSEDDAEVRQVTLVNLGDEVREIELTSYSELALAPQGADAAHPAFSKMFVQTEFLAESEAILATRRRRSAGEPEIWLAHLAVVDGEQTRDVEYETNRQKFLGRKRTARSPAAMSSGRGLSNSTGTVLDPILALRHTVRIPPGGVARVAFWTMVASSRSALIDAIDKHRDTAAFSRAATLAWSQAQVQLHHIGIDADQASAFQRLAGHLIFAGPELRPSSTAIQQGADGQPGLWGEGISGDLPILLLRISDDEHINLVRQLLLAHEYWRMKNFVVDLVILNERSTSYVQDLQAALESVVRIAPSHKAANLSGGAGRIYLLRADILAAPTRALLTSVARAILIGQRGSLVDQLDQAGRPMARNTDFPIRPRRRRALPAPQTPPLEFFNGHGGFAEQGREYVVILRPGETTPSPWSNIIANPGFGFHVSADGAGYTWCVNSRENQLTPWSNDPVKDPAGEAIYLRDEESGEVWSATADPVRLEDVTYVARHGFGYSRFQHNAFEIGVDLLQFVPIDDPIKISRLRIQNLSASPRQLSITAYVSWTLGPSRAAAAAFVATSLDEATGALLARNLWTPAFAQRVAFLDMGGAQSEWTGDRREFIGRNGELSAPAALRGADALSGAVGAGLDPCGAMRRFVALAPGETAEIVVFLGQGNTLRATQDLIGKYRSADLQRASSEVERMWDRVTRKVQVATPDRAMDVMLNGWLLYQTLSCRIWARSGFYQASGAYGFRDQLQDGMALAGARPDLTRAHLLRAAARQFIEGDVQHWWLPESGKGVRTRIADDRAWLAYTVAHYVRVTGDVAVLDEPVSFLEGQWLHEGEDDSFFEPVESDISASLFEHCARALDRSLAVGAHGLPLFGTGDWNDGMNRVGQGGRGESVWLAWFHCATLGAFAPLAEQRGEAKRAEAWTRHVQSLQKALESQAWDGEWYRRGFYDDGAPLGSADSAECRIDAIAQSWAVLSGAASPDRAARAMSAVERDLIANDQQLALLFTPPFDKTEHDPGYIKGYPPGLRENGGQYTHGALWSVFAFAKLGQGANAASLFNLINPIYHARAKEAAARYAVEPYVVAADVYAAPGHVGRGGWTWYTGSAGWMQRAGLEAILGVEMRGASLIIDPCIPEDWRHFAIEWRHGGALYTIQVTNPDGVCRGVASACLDGEVLADRPPRLSLRDDGKAHQVQIVLGPSTHGARFSAAESAESEPGDIALKERP